MVRHPTLFITHRGLTHQKGALESAPEELEIIMQRSPSKEEIINLIPNAEFLITERTGIIDADIITAGKNIKLIQRLGSQTWDIDLESAREYNIPVCYYPIYTCAMVAEHMIMQMLALAKRLREVMDIAAEANDWGKSPKKCSEDIFVVNWSGRKDLRGIYQSIIGIVGFGEIGTELARRLKNFGCSVLYNKRSRLPSKAETELNIKYTPLEELLAESDYVCMLLPFFPETEKIVNSDFIFKMKPGACIVSCGASGIFDEEAVAEALSTDMIYGVATDTYAWEPIRYDNPLLTLARDPRENIILTPHTATGSTKEQPKQRSDDFANLLNILHGKPLLYRLV